MHSFDEQLATAQKDEEWLDDYFSRWFEIEQVDIEWQRRGVDRFFTARSDGRRWSVEYKADHRTVETGNVFIETVSVDTKDILGWAYTSCAQKLVYYSPEMGRIMIAEMCAVKRELVRKWFKSRELPIPNRGRNGNGYNTKGIPIPVHEFERICEKVIDVGQE